jgi:hypothetical protein
MSSNNKKRQQKGAILSKENMKGINHKRKAITANTSALRSYTNKRKYV